MCLHSSKSGIDALLVVVGGGGGGGMCIYVCELREQYGEMKSRALEPHFPV